MFPPVQEARMCVVAVARVVRNTLRCVVTRTLQTVVAGETGRLVHDKRQ